MPKAAPRLVSIDLRDVIQPGKDKEKPKTTSIRLPLETIRKLDAIAKESRMSRTKLLRNLINAMIRDWDSQQGQKRK